MRRGEADVNIYISVFHLRRKSLECLAFNEKLSMIRWYHLFQALLLSCIYLPSVLFCHFLSFSIFSFPVTGTALTGNISLLFVDLIILITCFACFVCFLIALIFEFFIHPIIHGPLRIVFGCVWKLVDLCKHVMDVLIFR